ncbi:TatD family hydrolase, partial [Vibrio sp. S512-13]|uniref:TatD family hydrolase n=1 Tax=Vibrio sp. S512-13 TaxID=1620394 RepID=UPI0005EFBEFE
MLVDSHCHLDKLYYDDLHINIDDIINKAKEANVKELLSVGVTLDSFPNMEEMIERYGNGYASCGVHPLDVESAFSMEAFRRHASHERVVAIGETGLDYHYKSETAGLQKERFEQQVELAVEMNKPIIIL